MFGNERHITAYEIIGTIVSFALNILIWDDV